MGSKYALFAGVEVDVMPNSCLTFVGYAMCHCASSKLVALCKAGLL